MGIAGVEHETVNQSAVVLNDSEREA